MWHDNPTLAEYLKHVRREAQSDDPLLALLPMVIKQAKRYAHNPEELLDLIQVGNVGLLESRRTYDPAKGAFGAWALGYVKSAIRNYLQGADYFDRQGRHGALKTAVIYLNEKTDEYTEPGRRYEPDRDIKLLLGSRLLTREQRKILQARVEGATLQEIGRYLDLTHERVRQIERDGVSLLSGGSSYA